VIKMLASAVTPYDAEMTMCNEYDETNHLILVEVCEVSPDPRYQPVELANGDVNGWWLYGDAAEVYDWMAENLEAGARYNLMRELEPHEPEESS